MIMQYLAEAAGSGLSPEVVGGIIAAVIIGLLSGGVLGKKVSDHTKVQVGPQPFEVRMEKEFMPRSEAERRFTQLETSMAVNVTKTEGLFNAMMADVRAEFTTVAKRADARDERLGKKIEAVASGAYEARGRIHQNLNATREELKELKAVSQVADQIGKLADALNPQTKVQPTHPRQ